LIANLQTTPIAGGFFAFDIDLFANDGVAACTIVLELNAYHIATVVFKGVSKAVAAVGPSVPQYLAVLFDEVFVRPTRIGVIRIHIAVLDGEGFAFD